MTNPASTRNRSKQPQLVGRSLIFLTGKGGTGKSTMACALGLAASQAGQKTLICELSGNAHTFRPFGKTADSGNEVFELADRLWGTTIELESALKEWVGHQLRPRAVANLLSGSATFQYFAAASPGGKEMVVLRKLLRFVEQGEYDLVVVDAPASGHGIGLLRTPWTYSEIIPTGPLFGQIDRIKQLLTDNEKTGYLAVTLAAEMPVSETVELSAQLLERPGTPLDGVIANCVYPRRFSKQEINLLDSLTNERDNGIGSWVSTLSCISAARSEHRRASEQQSHLARLRHRLGNQTPTTTVPFIFEQPFGLEALLQVADKLKPYFRQ